MRRRKHKQSPQVILVGLIVPALLAVTLLYLLIPGGAANPSGKAEPRQKTARTRAAATKPASRQSQPSGYAVIAQRNLFQPLVEPEETAPPAPPPVKKVVPPSPPKVELPSVSLPPTPPIEFEEETVPSPAENNVTVVGSVQVNDEWYALVEDVSKGEARFVRAGESAFGYTVKMAGVDDAVLERDGRTFTVAMGNNKVPNPIRLAPGMVGAGRTSTPGRTFTPTVLATLPGGGGIPDLANMNSDQRRQWFEQWRETFRNMTPQQQEQARQQMRDYWRQIAEQRGFGGSGADRGRGFSDGGRSFGGSSRFRGR